MVRSRGSLKYPMAVYRGVNVFPYKFAVGRCCEIQLPKRSGEWHNAAYFSL